MRFRAPSIVAALVSVTTAFAPGSAVACSVPFMPGADRARDAFNAANIALTGRVTKMRYLDRAPQPGEPVASRRYEATIRVSRVYKGKTGPALRVRSSTSSAECGLGRLHVDKRLGLLLTGKRSPFAVGLMDRISYESLERVTGGRSHRPGRR